MAGSRLPVKRWGKQEIRYEVKAVLKLRASRQRLRRSVDLTRHFVYSSPAIAQEVDTLTRRKRVQDSFSLGHELMA